jgi:hypothetical protein
MGHVWGRGDLHSGFGGKIWGDNLEDLGIDGMIILERIFKEEDEDVYRMCLAQDRSKWRTLVSAVMKLLVA